MVREQEEDWVVSGAESEQALPKKPLPLKSQL